MTTSAVISIVGFGNVGSTLAMMFLHDETVDWEINIMEPSRSRRGRIEDFLHTSPLFPFRSIRFNSKKLLRESDFVIFAAGGKGKIRDDRTEVMDETIRITKDFFTSFRFKNKGARIIVVTNPVDVICYHVRRNSDLPAHQIIGTGTYLDTMRMSYYLSRQMKVPPAAVSTMVLVEHGDTIVPITSQIRIDGIKLYHKNLDINAVMEKTRRAAFHIKKTEEATVHGISACAYRIVHMLLHPPEGFVVPLSMQITPYYKKLLNVNMNIFLGLPVIFHDIGRPYQVLEWKLTSSEKKLMARSALKIRKLLN